MFLFSSGSHDDNMAATVEDVNGGGGGGGGREGGGVGARIRRRHSANSGLLGKTDGGEEGKA